MQIKQWEDKGLSHFSYAVLSENEKEIILVDPARDPDQYYKYAEQNDAKITGVIETHPHADFVSSHLEIHQTTGATLYTSKITQAIYTHKTFDEGDTIKMGELKLSALNTPGHSPDSICIVLEDDGKQTAVFTGDTLFVGDCGRPDLREEAGNSTLGAENLAKQMFHSLRDKLMMLPNETLVYPAHGAGSLCGKSLSEAHSGKIGEEKISNWSLQKMSEDEFVKTLLTDQPFVPAYFPYDVKINRTGAPPYKQNMDKLKTGTAVTNENEAKRLDNASFVIDVRDHQKFKNGHLKNSINLMEDTKFETWLGSIIHPDELFYLCAEGEGQLHRLVSRTAAIGYEVFIKEAFVINYSQQKDEKFDVDEFKKHRDDYTIIDVRNQGEVREKKLIAESISIPLSEIRDRIEELPLSKPIVVYCSSGYRSAAGASLIQSQLNEKAIVYDLGEAIKSFWH